MMTSLPSTPITPHRPAAFQPPAGGVGLLLLLLWARLVVLRPAEAFVLRSSSSTSPSATSRQFELGTRYEYDYSTKVLLDEPPAATLPSASLKDVGFKVHLKAEVTPIWQNPSSGLEQLLELKVKKPELSVRSRQGPDPEGFVGKSSRFQEKKIPPILLLRSQGRITAIYHTQEHDLGSLNILKGIASLLQYQVTSLVQSEVDASGQCDVTYKAIDAQHLSKSKKNCHPAHPSVVTFNHTKQVLAAAVESSAVTSFELSPEDKVVASATSLETHVLRVEVRRTSGGQVSSRQDFVLEKRARDAGASSRVSGETVADAVAEASKQRRQTLVTSDLATAVEPKECIACRTLPELLSNYRNSLKSSNLATQSAAIGFLRVLRKVRESQLADVKKMLKSKKNKEILPQLVDVCALAQTVASHKAAMSVLDFAGPIDLPERYLLTLALSTHPPEFVIQDLLKVVKKGVNNDKLQETLLLALASLTKTFRLLPAGQNKKVVIEVKKRALSGLEECKDEPCELMYTRVLRNLQFPSSVSLLLDLVETKPRKVAVCAIQALHSFPDSFFGAKANTRLERIFFELDRKRDSTVRALAADILLRHKAKSSTLRHLLKTMTSQKSKELNTLVLGRIRDLASKNEHLDKTLKSLFKDPELANYHILGQNGLSSAFSRPLAQDSSANASFSNLLEISGGLLKKLIVDVNVESQTADMKLLSFGIFAGGLNMFGGDGSEDDGEDANAGIEVSLLDSQLRPFVFFTGQGELMGHVWAGTGSERTTALQGTALLQDHSQVVALQNGLNTELLLTGVVSYDFAGQVQVSLWNRNAHGLVEVGAAVVLNGQVRVDSTFVQTMIEFNTAAQSQLNFVTDLDFYDEVLMCLQMVQPEFTVIDNVRKMERIPDSNYVLRKIKRKTVPLPGKTYVMNKKNTELCNKMFNK